MTTTATAATELQSKLNGMVKDYIIKFKHNIGLKLNELGCTDVNQKTELMQYIFDYGASDVIISKDDVTKKRTSAAPIPEYERCTAECETGKKCTRKRIKSSVYCGTHAKAFKDGLAPPSAATAATATDPHAGKITVFSELPVYRIQVWTHDFQGIIHHIDNLGNVYDASDILSNRMNPRIVAKYSVNESGVYSLV